MHRFRLKFDVEKSPFGGTLLGHQVPFEPGTPVALSGYYDSFLKTLELTNVTVDGRNHIAQLPDTTVDRLERGLEHDIWGDRPWD